MCVCLYSMPISPVTARLFQDKTFVQQEWEYLTHHISHLIPNTTYAMNTNDTDTKHYPSMGTPFSNNNVIFTNYDALPAGDIAGEWLALLYGLHAGKNEVVPCMPYDASVV